ncbi:LysR family transcriptional regulator ArgP [Marinobacterium sp. OS208]|nr:LysR family transcriptional regulator ArgP [Marinobacterium sedimentorum]
MMLDYRQIQALAAVIEEQSFERAAASLHITQSAVSQRLKQLEERLGQALVIRSSPVRATPAGQQVLKHYRQVSLLQKELLREVYDAEDSSFTRLSLGLNADSLSSWFLPALQPLLEQEKILLELKVDDQDQTHHLLRTGEVIGCITASPQAMQGCNCIPLGVMPYRCLVSPSYISHYLGGKVTAAGLRQAPAVEYNNKDALHCRYLERFYGLAAGDFPRHRVPSPDAFIDLIVRGFGAGMVPDQQSRHFLAKGLVVDLAPGNYLAVPLYWHVWNLKTPLARLLTETLLRGAEKLLEPFSDHPVLTHP